MNLKCVRTAVSFLTALCLIVSAPGGAWANSAADSYETTTPIKHVVVIFQENVSFDHYFGTYPYALNTTPGEPKFTARPNTPAVNNLLGGGLLTNNPNTVQPFRLSRSQSMGATICDQSHSYTPEQTAADHGLMDNFVAATGTGNYIWPSPLPSIIVNPLGLPVVAGQPLQPGQYYETPETATGSESFTGYCVDDGKGAGIVMSYFDGNTVTALWNYAQNFAMSDNSWDTNFGPSAPGAINLISGSTYSATIEPSPDGKTPSSTSGTIWGSQTTGALIGDARPYLDDCVYTDPQLNSTKVVQMNETTGTPANVGDLMGDASFTPAKQITWGWFAGGFAPTNGTATPAVCGAAHAGLYAGFGDGPLLDNITTVGDYIPHHEPFEFYASTRNEHHVGPTSNATIGQTDRANHQYDLSLFFTALANGNLPAVSFLKAPAYADAHPEYSDPLDEQIFLVNTINAIMASPDWKNTAIIIAYDDSDGWYDHHPSPIVNQSGETGNTDDVYFAPGFCGANALPTSGGSEGVQGRCGYGTRQPLLVISPWAKDNYVDHGVTDQSSILRFIEDNWGLGRLGNGTSDAPSSDFKAGTLNNMFTFSDDDQGGNQGILGNLNGNNRQLFLDPNTGEVVNFLAGNNGNGNSQH